MTAKELLQQKPETLVIDRFTEQVFTVAEWTPIIMDMLKEDQAEADTFCSELDLLDEE